MQYLIIDVWVADVSDGIIWSIFQIWSAPTGYEEFAEGFKPIKNCKVLLIQMNGNVNWNFGIFRIFISDSSSKIFLFLVF